MSRQVGDHCVYQHGNAAPACTWDGEKWTRDDELIIPNPFDSSNKHGLPGSN